ncbi:hypothetical protein [Fodinibius roseus]|nr:hypothetical protein [Fodinibius roseus]
MAADDAAFGGNHNNLIQNTFAARGVGSFVPLAVSMTGPGIIETGEQGTWNASVSNGNSPYNYTWHRRKPRSGPYQQVGTGSSYSGSGNGDQDFELKVVVTDSDTRSGTSMRRVIVGGIDHP